MGYKLSVPANHLDWEPGSFNINLDSGYLNFFSTEEEKIQWMEVQVQK